jgi:hypothetical protein
MMYETGASRIRNNRYHCPARHSLPEPDTVFCVRSPTVKTVTPKTWTWLILRRDSCEAERVFSKKAARVAAGFNVGIVTVDKKVPAGVGPTDESSFTSVQ